MPNPLVTIITPAYNRKDLIHYTIESIINQTYINWEYLIIDDGSDDGTLELCKHYALKDNRITVLSRAREPKGPSTCRNIGIELAKGRYIIFLDSDDLLHEDCLKSRVNKMSDNPELDFGIFPMLMFSEKLDDLRLLVNVETEENIIARTLSGDAGWQLTEFIWKKEALLKLGGLNEILNNCMEDFDLVLRAFLEGFNYKSFLKSKPDCFYRRIIGYGLANQSLIDQDFIKKKEQAFYNTLNLLEKFKCQESIIKQIKGLLVHIIVSYASRLSFQDAKRLLEFGNGFGLLTPDERRRLQFVIFSYKIGLHQFKGYYRLRSLIVSPFNRKWHARSIRYSGPI